MGIIFNMIIHLYSLCKDNILTRTCKVISHKNKILRNLIDTKIVIVITKRLFIHKKLSS